MKKIVTSMLLGSVLFANSLSLEFSYKQALSYESKVRSNMQQVYAKNEDINQAKSKLYPKIDFLASGTKRDYKLNYNGNKRKENYYTYKLSAQMPLYHPENYNIIDQTRLKYDYSNLYLTQLKQELGYNVIDAYMSMVRAKNSLLVANAYLQANRLKYQQISKMYDKRLANRMDFLESKLTFEQSKIKVSSEKHNLHLALVKFKNLTGIKNPDVPLIDFEKLDLSELYNIANKKEILKSNLEMQKSRTNLKIANKQIEQAYYGHYPKVDLSASVSKYDTDNSYTDYKHESTLMLNFRLPLYQGGYVKSLIAKNRYLLSASQEEITGVQRKVTSKYEEITVQMSEAKENIALYKDTIKSAELYLEAVSKGYEKGLKNLVDVENAKTKLYESKFKLIDAVYTYIKAYSGILNLSGKLLKENLANLDRILFQNM